MNGLFVKEYMIFYINNLKIDIKLVQIYYRSI